jgi:DHA1 family inner membrane transport protein
MNLALFALTAGAFGIGVTEFVIMGLLLEISRDMNVSISMAGLLISGYALGVVIGAPILTVLTTRWPRKQVLIGLMVIFTLGNFFCAIAPNYSSLIASRILTAFAHGTFFGVGSIVATNLVAPNKRASAIAMMFMGLTVANIIGVPFGTWLWQIYSWRTTFWAVTLIGVIALIVLWLFVPKEEVHVQNPDWRTDLKSMMRPQVLLGFLTTILGYAGVFAVFTYIAPILTQISGFKESAVSPILLLFGLGLVGGNLLGGKLADKNLLKTMVGTLFALALTLGFMSIGMHHKILSIIFVALLGAAAFATVAPLQMWVLSKAVGAGQGLASSLNIASFNLGNALGAWLGGVVIDHGPGLNSLFLIAAILPLIAIGVIGFSTQVIKNPIV